MGERNVVISISTFGHGGVVNASRTPNPDVPLVSNALIVGSTGEVGGTMSEGSKQRLLSRVYGDLGPVVRSKVKDSLDLTGKFFGERGRGYLGSKVVDRLIGRSSRFPQRRGHWEEAVNKY